jgi:hypothetical protein
MGDYKNQIKGWKKFLKEYLKIERVVFLGTLGKDRKLISIFNRNKRWFQKGYIVSGQFKFNLV